ncbi:MAG: T9SS type A sorting domain-containing protein, partial [Chitinophagales bacterium]
YTWQVRSVCSSNPLVASDWSGKQHFTTSLRVGLDEASNALDVYPNPFSSSAVISFSLLENSHAVIEVYDLSGKTISTVLDQNLDAGDHSVQLNRNQLSDGIYLVQLKMNDQISAMKIVLQ